MNQIHLENLCLHIRNCLDNWSADGTLEALTGSITNSFPNGCCGLVSECLSVILYKLTGTRPNQVCAVCNYGDRNYNKLAANSHRWIELNGVNIDLTGDQFNDVNISIPAVLVSSSPHPLSSLMQTTIKPAYLIGITEPASGFDFPQLRLISELTKHLGPFSSQFSVN